MGSLLDIVVPVGLCIAAIIAAAIVYSVVVAVKSRRAARGERAAWDELHSDRRRRVRDDGGRRR